MLVTQYWSSFPLTFFATPAGLLAQVMMSSYCTVLKMSYNLPQQSHCSNADVPWVKVTAVGNCECVGTWQWPLVSHFLETNGCSWWSCPAQLATAVLAWTKDLRCGASHNTQLQHHSTSMTSTSQMYWDATHNKHVGGRVKGSPTHLQGLAHPMGRTDQKESKVRTAQRCCMLRLLRLIAHPCRTTLDP